ncbi:MAG: hypothetical protein ABEH40_05165 [Haloferacaceae archaeon]
MRSPLTRRRLLAFALGAALPSGGCLGSSGDGATTEATADATAGSPTTGDGPVRRAPGDRHVTEEGWSLTVAAVGVRHGVVQFGTVHPDPLWRDGAQFVVADAVVAGDGAPDPADLRLFVRTDTLDRSDRYYVHAATDADDRRQRFGFPVPTDPAPARAGVVWAPAEGPTVRWALPDGLVRDLGVAPAFAVESFDVPETAAPDDEFEAAVTVRNDGDRDGRFLAEVGNGLVSDQPETTLDVPAGGTATARPTVDARFGDRDELPVVLRWEGGTERRTVRRAG